MSKSTLATIDVNRGNQPRSQYIESVIKESEKKAKNKIRRNGSVYTPTAVADFVAEKVVSYYFNNSKNLSSTSIKIIDPACGDGELLDSVWKNLSNTKHPRTTKFETLLYGIDNDHIAIKQTRKRFEQKYNINRGILRLIKTNALFPFNKKRSEQGWEEIFKKFDVDQRFDIVIANPPWGADCSSYREKLTAGDYKLCKGQFDTSDLFVELAFNILKDGGCLAYIVSDSLFKQERQDLRKLLLTNTEILFIGRFGENIFDNVFRGCAVIICRKGNNDKNKIDCFRLTPEARKKILTGDLSFTLAEKQLGHSVSQRRFTLNKDFIFDIDVVNKEKNTLSKLTNCEGSFRDHLTSTRGVELSKNGKVIQCDFCQLWFPLPNSEKRSCPHCKEVLFIAQEKSVCITSQVKVKGYSTLVTGVNVCRYQIHSHYFIDTSKQGIKYKDRSVYSAPKLLLRKTGVGISAAIDYSNAFTNQVVYIFNIKSEMQWKLPLEFFLGVLNSRAIYYYLVKNFGETEWRSHPYITQKQVLDFPLPHTEILKSAKNKDVIQSIAKTLVPFTSKNKLISAQADAKIEKCVADLFNLHKDDYINIYATLESVENLLPVRALKQITINDIFNT